MTNVYVRVAHNGSVHHAEVTGDTAVLYAGAPWSGGKPTGEKVTLAGGLADDRLRTPVTPSKILCVGRNYAAHAKELGNELPVEPMIFFKPPSSLVDPGAPVVLPDPSISEKIEHEAELAVVVGARLRDASEAEAAAAVFGYGVACDVTARDLQKKDGQWWRAKGMDTFCPLGPAIVRGVDVGDVRVRCLVNDAVKQDGRTKDMIFSIARVLSHVSRAMTLEPGDLVLTGTPEGVGPLVDGDRLVVDIEGVGRLETFVRGREAAR